MPLLASKAGAEVVQIFDTWSGVLGPEQFERWCITPMQRIVAGVRQQISGAKIIGFPRGAGAMALPYVELTAISAIGIHWLACRLKVAKPFSGSVKNASAPFASN